LIVTRARTATWGHEGAPVVGEEGFSKGRRRKEWSNRPGGHGDVKGEKRIERKRGPPRTQGNVTAYRGTTGSKENCQKHGEGEEKTAAKKIGRQCDTMRRRRHTVGRAALTRGFRKNGRGGEREGVWHGRKKSEVIKGPGDTLKGGNTFTQ